MSTGNTARSQPTYVDQTIVKWLYIRSRFSKTPPDNAGWVRLGPSSCGPLGSVKIYGALEHCLPTWISSANSIPTLNLESDVAVTYTGLFVQI